MLLDTPFAHIDIRIRVTVLNQVSDSLCLVLPDVTPIRDMAHDIAFFECIIINQHKIADTTHRQTERDKAAARTQTDNADFFLSKAF